MKNSKTINPSQDIHLYLVSTPCLLSSYLLWKLTTWGEGWPRDTPHMQHNKQGLLHGRCMTEPPPQVETHIWTCSFHLCPPSSDSCWALHPHPLPQYQVHQVPHRRPGPDISLLQNQTYLTSDDTLGRLSWKVTVPALPFPTDKQGKIQVGDV